jgi:hypothetical protein
MCSKPHRAYTHRYQALQAVAVTYNIHGMLGLLLRCWFTSEGATRSADLNNYVHTTLHPTDWQTRDDALNHQRSELQPIPIACRFSGEIIFENMMTANLQATLKPGQVAPRSGRRTACSCTVGGSMIHLCQ